MDFDLVIRGGEVVDPGSGLLGRPDVGIRGGVIAAVDRSLPAEGAGARLDAAGQVVTPGLFDLHTHLYSGATYWGIAPDPIAARTGVTTWLDAGTAGAYSFPGFRRYVVEASEARVLALLNVSSIGLIAPAYELTNLDYCDLGLARQMVDANRDVILGIKARIDANTTRGVGIEPLRLARKLADQVGLPLMVHIGKGPPRLDEIFTLLRPGDILTHCSRGTTTASWSRTGGCATSFAARGTKGSFWMSGTGQGASATRSPSGCLRRGWLLISSAPTPTS